MQVGACPWPAILPCPGKHSGAGVAARRVGAGRRACGKGVALGHRTVCSYSQKKLSQSSGPLVGLQILTGCRLARRVSNILTGCRLARRASTIRTGCRLARRVSNIWTGCRLARRVSNRLFGVACWIVQGGVACRIVCRKTGLQEHRWTCRIEPLLWRTGWLAKSRLGLSI